ncbi:putative inorganic phosphate cotransporter [Oppia nitens]|uniref:putative inorganic phosphate cotransporter n=1 Tax=Oppia nitens TaxID=1686743 RepID=UPI0023DA2F72|nr:putative inorganic phosphate cotransporter [Oppia nitens]
MCDIKYAKINKPPVIPCRVTVGVLGSLGCMLLFVVRSNLSVAIIAMVDEKLLLTTETNINNNSAVNSDNTNNFNNNNQDICYDINSIVNITTTDNNDITGKIQYDWSQSVQGIVLGSYFYGYTLTQFCGTFADRFGAKWMIGFGVFIPAILNAFIPAAASIHYMAVVVVRLLMGAFHGVVFSCLFSMFAKWFPQSEMTYPVTGILFAGNLGGVITMPLAGYLCELPILDGWPTVFYVTSLMHILWVIMWFCFVHNSPADDPRIGDDELKYINANKCSTGSKTVRNLQVPWRAILLSRVVWASMVTKICCAFSYYILAAKMPSYLDTVFGLSIQTNSWFNSLFYATLGLSVLGSGSLTTWVASKQWTSLTRTRKNFQTFGMTCACISVLIIPMVGCDSNAVISVLLVGMFLFGFGFAGGEYAAIPEYAPNYAGTVFGVTNTLASTTGFMAPLFVGLLLDYGEASGVRHQWNIVWYTSAAVYIFGALVYELFGTAEPQHWAIANNNSGCDDVSDTLMTKQHNNKIKHQDNDKNVNENV